MAAAPSIASTLRRSIRAKVLGNRPFSFLLGMLLQPRLPAFVPHGCGPDTRLALALPLQLITRHQRRSIFYVSIRPPLSVVDRAIVY